MRVLKNFTVIELGTDTEAPMVGTITNISDDEQGKFSLKTRLQKALEDFFDCAIENMPVVPDMFCGSPYEDFEIIIPDYGQVQIRILETWIY